MLRLCLLALSFASAAATNAAGQKFLDENKNKEGVVTLPSGLQYKVLRSGDGDSHPTADSSCECHYEGRTAQEYIKSPKGETFDSSYAFFRPPSMSSLSSSQVFNTTHTWRPFDRSVVGLTSDSYAGYAAPT